MSGNLRHLGTRHPLVVNSPAKARYRSWLNRCTLLLICVAPVVAPVVAPGTCNRLMHLWHRNRCKATNCLRCRADCCRASSRAGRGRACKDDFPAAKGLLQCGLPSVARNHPCMHTPCKALPCHRRVRFSWWVAEHLPMLTDMQMP